MHPVIAEHKRQAPDEWNQLLGDTTAILAERPGFLLPARAAIQQVIERVEQILPNNEALENTKYYMLGIFACSLAIDLQDDSKRGIAIREVGNSLTDTWKRESLHPNGLTARDIRRGGEAKTMTDIFVHATLDSSKQLNPEVRLLADCIAEVVRTRAYNATPGVEPVQTYNENDILIGKSAAEMLGLDAMNGAAGVISGVIKRIDAHARGITERILTNNPVLAETLSGERFKQLDLRKIALRGATLRIDEFLHDFGEYVDIDESGAPFFRIDLVPAQSDLEPAPAPILHKKRIRCPALYISGLIPFMVDMLKEGIFISQEQIVQYRSRV